MSSAGTSYEVGAAAAALRSGLVRVLGVRVVISLLAALGLAAVLSGMSSAGWVAVLIIAGALLSEDATCIVAGLMMVEGSLSPAMAITSCLCGIALGDVVLYATGRLAGERWRSRLLCLAGEAKVVPASALPREDGGGSPEGPADWSGWGGTLLWARFMPGKRLPTHLSAGALGVPLGVYLPRVLGSILLWIPVAVVAIPWAVARVAALVSWDVAMAVPAVMILCVSVGIAGVMALRGGAWTLGHSSLNRTALNQTALHPGGKATLAPSERNSGDRNPAVGSGPLERAMSGETGVAPSGLLQGCVVAWVRDLVVRFDRLRRWEFWPTKVLYTPVVPWVLLQGLRHRSLTVATAANPGIPLGGLVGESKAQILSLLDPAYVMPYRLLTPGEPEARLRPLRDSGLTYPLIFKPDQGERGASVRLIRSDEQALEYLARVPVGVVAQAYHPGPFEAGVFYYRLPGEPAGHIFSITDKVFPVVTGDGVATLAQLIAAHPRYRLQRQRFYSRLAGRLGDVPAMGEQVRLALAGNHCQGTLFLDGRRLITPQLEATADRVLAACQAKRETGIFYGRFDVRYSDEAAFKRGEDFHVIELNGITSEATAIYDPANSFLQGVGTLCRQWGIAYRIGAANRARGVRAATLAEVLQAVRESKERGIDTMSD